MGKKRFLLALVAVRFAVALLRGARFSRRNHARMSSLSRLPTTPPRATHPSREPRNCSDNAARFYSGMNAACRGAADEQRNLKVLALHLARDVLHFVKKA
jgi:hypothetical protein